MSRPGNISLQCPCSFLTGFPLQGMFPVWDPSAGWFQDEPQQKRISFVAINSHSRYNFSLPRLRLRSVVKHVHISALWWCPSSSAAKEVALGASRLWVLMKLQLLSLHACQSLSFHFAHLGSQECHPKTAGASGLLWPSSHQRHLCLSPPGIPCLLIFKFSFAFKMILTLCHQAPFIEVSKLEDLVIISYRHLRKRRLQKKLRALFTPAVLALHTPWPLFSRK